MVPTTLWACQPKQNRQDTDNLQWQSATKRNKPQWQILSRTWPPWEYAWYFATFPIGSHRHPGRHRSYAFANWETTTRPTLFALHMRQLNSPELEVYEYQRHIFGARDPPAGANFVFQQTVTSKIYQIPWKSFSGQSTWMIWPHPLATPWRFSLRPRMSGDARRSMQTSRGAL